MIKPIRSILLLAISILIILYIVNAFYDAFTRAPVKNDSRSEPSDTSITQTHSNDGQHVSGTIEGLGSNQVSSTNTDTFVNPAQQQNNNSEQATNASSADPTNHTTNNSADSTTSTNHPTNSDQPVGTALRENPYLRGAIPPVPSAPSSPSGSTVIVPTAEHSFELTGSTSNSSFPEPINEQAPNSTAASSPAEKKAKKPVAKKMQRPAAKEFQEQPTIEIQSSKNIPIFNQKSTPTRIVTPGKFSTPLIQFPEPIPSTSSKKTNSNAPKNKPSDSFPNPVN